MKNCKKQKILINYKKNIMRILFSILSIFFFSQLFCDESDKLISYHPYYCPSYKNDDNKEKIIQNSQIMPGYNAPGRYDFTFFVSGTYLFFQPLQKGSIFAYSHNDLEKNRTFDMNFKYKSGFRISLGCNTKEDDWSVILNYMRFHSSKSKNIHQDAISTWALSDSSIIMSHINAKWLLSLDIIDLLLSRPFYSGTHFIITPSFGLKGGWTHQKFDTNSLRKLDQHDFFSKNKLKSYLIGLTANIKSRYIMDFGLSFFAKAVASLFYQDFNVKNEQNYLLNNIISQDSWLNSVSYINPNTEISAGIEWGNYFFKKYLHLTLLFGYEAQVYWNQNLMTELKEYKHNYYMQEAGSLFLHGIIAKLRLDF